MNAELFENLRLELRRGCLAVAVLAQLRVEHYGYTLRKALADAGLTVDEGTLYPLLRRLETQGLLVSEWREENKRNKRFYRLSADGAAILAQLLDEWHGINVAIDKIAQGEMNMELLDRYLNAVRFWLPNAQQDSIIAELGDDIRSQMEEAESSLGRPLSEDDVAALLKQRGHPMLMAGRYLPQRSLIGPVLYPAYVVALRVVVLWVLIPVFLLIVGPITIATAASPALASVQTVWTMAMACIFALGVVTLCFAILERHPIRELERWDPRKLPRVPAMKPVIDPGGPVPRSTAIAELVFSVIFTGFCIQVSWYRAGFDLDVVHVALAPIWSLIYFPVLATFMVGIVTGWASLVWPTRARLRAAIRLVTDALIFIVLGVLANAGSWFILTSAKFTAAQLAAATKGTNLAMKIALASAAIFTLVDVVQEIRRFYGARGPVIDIRR